MELSEILDELKCLGNSKVIETKKKFGIQVPNSLGIFLKDLKVFAKKISKKDHLAKDLFDSKVYEARLLVPMIFHPNNLTSSLMDKWVKCFNSWEICDTYCMGFFGQSSFVYEKSLKWANQEGEYQRRAGFVCMVAYAFTNKSASNEDIASFFSYIIKYSEDDRVYVKKAINWALRQIAKRNNDLFQEAIEIASFLAVKKDKSAQWIGRNALIQLRRPKIHMKNYPRNLYAAK